MIRAPSLEALNHAQLPASTDQARFTKADYRGGIFSIMLASADWSSHRYRTTLPQMLRISSRPSAEGPRGLLQLLSLLLSIRQQQIYFAHAPHPSLIGGV